LFPRSNAGEKEDFRGVHGSGGNDDFLACEGSQGSTVVVILDAIGLLILINQYSLHIGILPNGEEWIIRQGGFEKGSIDTIPPPTFDWVENCIKSY